ncbi:MAG TPA: translation elongation factor Ts [Candidatus Dormibacteraeota bacterium]|nr:translation elongation factor Ts [Candidatus Dormibacteraeota bacterium]
MARISMELIKQLREMSGAGMMDCKHALEEADGDLEKAFTILREKGIAKASKRADRATGQGVVEAYLHTTGDDYPPQVGVLIEVNCETDFVAKSPDFRKLAKELALQVAGYEPRWVSREDVPDDVLVHERNLYEAKATQEGKPEQIILKIVESQVENFLKQNCLMEQPYFREPSHTIQQLIAENISRLQENITVRRFARFNIRES